MPLARACESFSLFKSVVVIAVLICMSGPVPGNYHQFHWSRLKVDMKREKTRRGEARAALEEEWLASMRDKQRRLLDDLQGAREQGIRLHQQCERYHRYVPSSMRL